MTGVRLSAVVMTHPARVEYAERLRDQHPELDLQLVIDPAPDERGGALRTARLAWDAVAPDATHHLVIQDDTLLCDSFPDHLLRAIAARPGHAIGLYTEWGSQTSYAVRLAALCGSAWAEVVDDYVPTQALVLPAEVARGFSAFSCDPGLLDDFAMYPYLAAAGIPACVTVPNLADDAQRSSIVGHDYLGKRASVCFLPAGPGEIAWSVDAALPAAIPAFSYAIGQSYSLVRGPDRRWRHAAYPVIHRYGRVVDTTLELGRATIHDWPDQVRVTGVKLLLGLWLTAYGLGLVVAELLSPGVAELTRPIPRHALATMPHGALRLLVDERQLADHSSRLLELVVTGIRQGHEARLPSSTN